MAEPTLEEFREILGRVAPLLTRIRTHMLGLSIRGDRDLERDLLRASVLAQIGNVLDKDRALFDLLVGEDIAREKRLRTLYEAAQKAKDTLDDIRDPFEDIAKPLTLKEARATANRTFYIIANALDAVDKARDL